MSAYLEQRKHPRIDVVDLTINVSDGLGFYSGSIQNLSRFGLLMSGLPLQLDQDAKRLSIVVSGHNKHFKMVATPKWTKENQLRKDVGVELVNAPWGWTEFVMSLEADLAFPFRDEHHFNA